ncbi:phage tail tape measure protein [Serratia ureilytica]
MLESNLKTAFNCGSESGQPDPQLTVSEQQARGMGSQSAIPRSSPTSANSAGKTRVECQEILTASPAALTLSAATGSSVNEATATMTEMLHSFNMGSDQFDRIADVLALASNQYGMDIRAVGAAMKSKATTGVDIVSAAQQIAPSGREKLQANQVAGSAQHLVTVKGDNMDGDIQSFCLMG